MGSIVEWTWQRIESVKITKHQWKNQRRPKLTESHTTFIGWKNLSPQNWFNAIPSKIPARIFVDTYKLILKYVWKGISPTTTKTILGKRKQEGKKGRNNSTQYYYIATVIRALWYWRDRQMDQWKTIENP